jgi:two-component system, OmpR family, sensor histidine kinase KdpD
MSVGCPSGAYPMNFTFRLISESDTASRRDRQSRIWLEYLAALAITGACTAIAFPLSPPVSPVNVIMLYLVGTTLGALRLGRGPSALTAVTNTLAFNYFFVPPIFSFEVDDVQYIFAMGVMLIVALVIANLMISIRRHSGAADARERRTAVLYAMSRELAVASDARAMGAAAIRHIRSVFHCGAVVLVADEHGHLSPIAAGQECARDDAPLPTPVVDAELARHAAASAARHVKDAIYLPLHDSPLVKGVIVVWPRTPAPTIPEDQLRLLEAFAVQLALSLQRARLAEAAEAANASADRAVLRNTLLASISHDLRTPLSAIAGAGSLIAQAEYALNVDRRTTLGLLIERKARDMSQLLSNVLELMQMEFGTGELHTRLAYGRRSRVAGTAMPRGASFAVANHTGYSLEFPAALGRSDAGREDSQQPAREYREIYAAGHECKHIGSGAGRGNRAGRSRQWTGTSSRRPRTSVREVSA